MKLVHNSKYEKKIRLEIQKQEHGDVPFFVFPIFEESGLVRHLFSTKLGGVSEGEFASMNLSFIRGDKNEAVEENFRRIGEVLGLGTDHFVLSNQVHSNQVFRVFKEDAGKGYGEKPGFEGVDGFVTNERNLVLSTFYADCVPLFFLDPVKKAIGLSHAGWKGSALEIGRKTVEKMTAEFQSDPKDILVAIGPSICQKCYEVSQDVVEAFQSILTKEELEQVAEPKEEGKYQFDLWMANYFLLKKAGVSKENIQITDICTCCNKDLLFSHRATNGRRGNLGAFLVLK